MDNKDVGLEGNGRDVEFGVEFDGSDVDVGAMTFGDVRFEIEIGDKGMGIGFVSGDGMCVGMGGGDGMGEDGNDGGGVDTSVDVTEFDEEL